MATQKNLRSAVLGINFDEACQVSTTFIKPGLRTTRPTMVSSPVRPTRKPYIVLGLFRMPLELHPPYSHVVLDKHLHQLCNVT